MQFQHTITTTEQLREVISEPREAARLKQIDVIDEHARAFLAKASFALIATSNAAGQCDVSPKGDVPGFVQVLDEHTIVIPDRPGNNRTDSLLNILENPHAGLLFIIPGVEWTLRVNGRASIVRDEDILDSLAARDKRPLVAIGVEVEECFFHCPKAFRRSQLWEPEAWPDHSVLPSMACVLYDKLKPADKTLEEYLRESEENIQRTLY